MRGTGNLTLDGVKPKSQLLILLKNPPLLTGFSVVFVFIFNYKNTMSRATKLDTKAL